MALLIIALVDNDQYNMLVQFLFLSLKVLFTTCKCWDEIIWRSGLNETYYHNVTNYHRDVDHK